MKDSAIGWTDHTFNPWIGCTKVSPGCANCYAETMMDKRYGRVKWGKGNPRQRTSEANWKQPIRWNRVAGQGCAVCEAPVGDCDHENNRRPRVFCASLADWLDEEVPLEWLEDLLDLIRCTPNLDWLLLTKRPENFIVRIGSILTENDELAAWLLPWLLATGEFVYGDFDGLKLPPHNVWIGTTVEDQTRADERIPHLLRIPARVRFLSCEPLLGPVKLSKEWLSRNGVDWVIAGGESGPGARYMEPAWVMSLRLQCAFSDVPFFFKQWGKQARGNDLMGMKFEEFPRVRMV